MNNQQVRQHIRNQRRLIPPHLRQQADKAVKEQVLRLVHYRLAQHIAFYLAQDGEIDPQALLQEAEQTGKNCYLPVLHPRKTHTLYFMPYTSGDQLVANRYGILEPVFDETKIFPTFKLDLVIVPLVAFDAHYNRLGMGKGYYDRTFAFLNTPARVEKPYLLGVAHKIQQVHHLAVEAHDVRLNAVISV